VAIGNATDELAREITAWRGAGSRITGRGLQSKPCFALWPCPSPTAWAR
jgi:hypothetical protein